jgi:murein DD-endopeptidase MepM/ murein hydrolase activator NlpD
VFHRKARGLFDLTMAALAVATLWSSTPLGELGSRLGRWALGRPGRQTALVSFFRAGELDPAIASGTASDPLATVAAAWGAAPSLLRAFALASTPVQAGEPARAQLSAEGRALLLERGAVAAELEQPEGRLRAVGRALPALESELGSRDAALAALVLGLTPVRYAVGRVRAERNEPCLERLLPHLPPGARGRARSVVGTALTLATAFELSWPVAPGTRITSRFGKRTDPFTGATRTHTGVDLSVPVGTPLLSSGDAVVSRVGEDGVNGRYLILDHGRGVTSAYCHADAILVARGSTVRRGERVADSGNTGRSTGPHLHYQVELDGTPVDPLGLLGGTEERQAAK